jgi:hypothetical protein
VIGRKSGNALLPPWGREGGGGDWYSKVNECLSIDRINEG